MEGGPNDPKQRPLYGASAPAVDPACGPSVPPADAKPAALGPFGQSMATSAPSSIRVNGIPVSFPFTPYRSQYAMMHNIVKVVREKQHALVESPTGTGKSMALLCATLAFQKHAKAELNAQHARAVEDYFLKHPELAGQGERLAKAALHVKKEVTGDGVLGEGAKASGTILHDLHAAPGPMSAQERGDGPGMLPESKLESRGQSNAFPQSSEYASSGENGKEAGKQQLVAVVPSSSSREERPGGGSESRSEAPKESGVDADGDFVAPKRARNVSWQNGSKRVAAAVPKREEVPENAHFASQLDNGLDGDVEAMECDDFPVRQKPPRIFYTSRTHSQLKQVVGELRASGYKPSMTVLASRGEYCLNQSVKAKRNRNEACKDAVKDSLCSFWHGKEKVSQSVRESELLFDIEDLLQIGADKGGCSYYAAVELMMGAELILCPYNYIIDAVVRKARDIQIDNDIVIFDEAHNIEDHAREAASFSGEISAFVQGAKDIDDLIIVGALPPSGSPLFKAYRSIQKLMNCCDSLASRILESGRMAPTGQAKEVALFEPGEMLTEMDAAGLDKPQLNGFHSALHAIASSVDEDYPSKAGRFRRRSGAADSNTQGEEDIDQTVDEDVFNAGSGVGTKGRKMRGGRDTFRDKGGKKPGCPAVGLAESLVTVLRYVVEYSESYKLALERVQSNWESKTTLSWWCLNAAVPFTSIRDSARSMIVCSGTLTPLASFAGELDVPFSVAKSLPHVVNVQRQVLSVVVAHGPRNVSMNGSYRFTGTTAWQDSVGEAILSYSKVIPGGVLVFFPSYRVLNECTKRWKTADIHVWEQLEAAKGLVVCESSGHDKEAFKESIKAYKTAAEHSPMGAVMMGVCRGKISEGIDFKDHQARGVIVVGVPYPNSFCPQLNSKKEWNDSQRRSGRTELLTSNDWYEMQAFRALNQAIGRCVRHKRDYGAIIFLDQRYKRPAMVQQLPSWVRASIRPNMRGKHDETVQALTSFFATVEEVLPPP